jgi:hypothetical protein
MIESQTLIANLYNQIRDGDEQRPMERWHASSIAQCPRAQYFGRLGIQRTRQPGAGMVLRWKAGHLIEEVIRPYLKHDFPDLQSSIRFESAVLDLTGELDNYSQSEKAIIEIKSVSGHAVKYRRVGDDRHHLRDEKQYLHHEYQQACYVKLLRETNHPVEQIVYLYITLDGLLVPYVTPINKEALDFVSIRLERLNEFWLNQQVPPCQCQDETSALYKPVMQYCDYSQEGKDCCDLSLLDANKLDANKLESLNVSQNSV